MKIEYVRACREAGMAEEQIREIHRFFDADYKRLYRERAARNKAGYVCYSLEQLKNPEGDACYFDLPDPEMNVEQIILHKLELEKLDKALSLIPEKERQFIMDCFEAEWGAGKEIAEKYGMTIGAVKQRKRRIIKKIRKMYFSEC